LVLVLAFALAGMLLGVALAAPGDLDPTFSGDGKVTTRFPGGTNEAQGMAIQADGKVVVVGWAGGDDTKFVLVRFNTDGTLDSTFGAGGKVRTNLTPWFDGAGAVAIQADGKLVVAGWAGGSGRRFALVRYNADGALDTSFGLAGKVATNFTPGADQAFGVAIQADGKIVAVGGAALDGRGERFALARYNADGTPDTSFSADGKVTIEFTRWRDHAEQVAVQADGKIVAAGTAALFGSRAARFALVRLNPNGTLDSTFSADGKVTSNFVGENEFAMGVAIQTDGKIVAAGESGQTRFSVDTTFALARYNADGTLDTAFDGDGKVTTNFTSEFDGAWGGLAIQADGKIVAAGHASFLRFAVARYAPNGTLDTSFSGDGKATTKFGFASEVATGVAIQADGKIVAAGDIEEAQIFAVARFLGG
jgi:uncharacterized delta-60 repeat protein